MGKLTLEGLEILDAIDRRGSFAAAAEVLHKVPSTISYTVARIEEELQVTLFRRHGPRIEITPAGTELLREGRLLLQAASDLECRVQRVASGWESTFQIGLDSLVPTEALATHVAAFQSVAGTTRLRIVEEALTGTWESLLDARSDLVVAAGTGPAGGGYRTTEVARIAFWFCVAPFHPLAREAEPLAQAQVRAHTAIIVADSARRLPVRTTGLLSGQATLTVPHMRAKLRLQLEGLGVGYLPRTCAEPLVDLGVLVRKRLQDEREPEALSVAWRVPAQGKALEWWTSRLSDREALRGILHNVGLISFTLAGGRAPR